MFVWVDEPGTATRDAIWKYSYALCGMRSEYRWMLTRGKKVNVIAAMFSTGIVALDLITADTVNGDKFFEFLRASLIPHHRYKTLEEFLNAPLIDACSQEIASSQWQTYHKDLSEHRAVTKLCSLAKS